MVHVTNSRTKFSPHSQSFNKKVIESNLSMDSDLSSYIQFSRPNFSFSMDSSLHSSLVSSFYNTIVQYDICAFTDDSKTALNTGAGAVIFLKHNINPWKKLQWKLRHSNYVFQAELVAIKETILILSSLPPFYIQGTSIAIFTDSQSSIKALTNNGSASSLVIQTRQLIEYFSLYCSFHLCWVKGHS